MSMDVEEAICLVLTLQNRPQTSMNGELRSIYQRALRVVDSCAQARIDEERRASQVTNGTRGCDNAGERE